MAKLKVGQCRKTRRGAKYCRDSSGQVRFVKR